MPGLLRQNGQATRETALADVGGGRRGLLSRPGFRTSPGLFDAKRATTNQAAIAAAKANAAQAQRNARRLAADSQASVARAGSRGDGSRGGSDIDPNPVPGFGFVDAAINIFSMMNPIGVANFLGGIIANPTSKTPSLINEAARALGLTGGADPGTGGMTNAGDEQGGAQAVGAEGPSGGESGTNAGDEDGGASSVGGEGGAGGPDGGGGSGCFPAGTPVLMADSSVKLIKAIEIGDHTAGGKVTGVMKFAAPKMYDYAGVIVSGEQAVREGGRWVRVEDSDGAVSVDYPHPVVHDFDCTHHRIYVNGVTFSDYSEVDAGDSELDALLETLNTEAN